MDSITTLVTDGGPHPVEKWVALTVSQIMTMIQIDESSASPEAVAARYAKRDLGDALTEMLTKSYEKAKLDFDGPLDPTPYIPLDEFRQAVTGGPFEQHFENHINFVRYLMGKSAANVMHIERQYKEAA